MSGQALRFPGGLGSKISWLSWHEWDKVVSPYVLGAFTPQEIFQVLISVRRWVNTRAIVQPEGLRQWKIPVTQSGIEPATFRFVVQCLNQLRHCVPHSWNITEEIYSFGIWAVKVFVRSIMEKPRRIFRQSRAFSHCDGNSYSDLGVVNAFYRVRHKSVNTPWGISRLTPREA
jgi:hypothetical protein